jgi:hypothetical protein
MIAIYRACNAEMTSDTFKAERPEWFDKKKCWLSFYESWIASQKPRDIHVVFDGDENCDFANYIKSFKIGKFVSIDYRNNGLSLLCCYELANTMTFDGIYFIEDDYIHTKEAIQMLKNGVDAFQDFMITLYDHPDRYTRDDDVTRGRESIYMNQDCHWRTAESTTCTVAMSNKTFNNIIKDMMVFSNQDRQMFRHFVNRGVRLLTPITGQATHVNKFFMSPFKNWEKI